METCIHTETCICYGCVHTDVCGCGECETEGVMPYEEGECDDCEKK